MTGIDNVPINGYDVAYSLAMIVFNSFSIPFLSAVPQAPPRGICHFPDCRAITTRGAGGARWTLCALEHRTAVGMGWGGDFWGLEDTIFHIYVKLI